MGKYTKNTSFQHPLVVVEGGCIHNFIALGITLLGEK
jgi:hypothetical protein